MSQLEENSKRGTDRTRFEHFRFRISNLFRASDFGFRISLTAMIAFAATLCPAPAQAHLNSTGMGPIYDGLMHFLMSPEDLVPVLALAMLAGMRGASHGRSALFVLPGAWLLGGLLGLTTAVTNESALVSSLWFLLLGGLVAADARLPVQVTCALALVL